MATICLHLHHSEQGASNHLSLTCPFLTHFLTPKNTLDFRNMFWHIKKLRRRRGVLYFLVVVFLNITFKFKGIKSWSSTFFADVFFPGYMNIAKTWKTWCHHQTSSLPHHRKFVITDLKKWFLTNSPHNGKVENFIPQQIPKRQPARTPLIASYIPQKSQLIPSYIIISL